MEYINGLFLNIEQAENVMAKYMADCEDKRAFEAWVYLLNMWPRNLAKPEASHAVLSDVGELLPCPFCGSTNIKHFGVRGDNMYCRSCGAEGPAGDGEYESAKDEWNKRANVR